ncbi:MAG TPA: aspartate/glutamate racemase family protein [Thermoanaerobaculia bacterium]|nr:aspartate/glutamate racemase family protein [Thermoanaerobaculia bacterium]
MHILITDSGVGGLSVCAYAERFVRTHGFTEPVRLTFANAAPESDYGYNSMPSREEKLETFDRFLRNVTGRFAPDFIYVACNTLSVLLPDTPYVANAPIPVKGIIETAVDLLASELQTDRRSVAMIFGTQTTIDAGAYPRLLEQRGIEPARIISQACPGLADTISEDREGTRTAAEIRGWVARAVEKMQAADAPIVACLACTHYGYRKELFAAALPGARIINPNESAVGDLFPSGSHGDHRQVEVEFVTRYAIPRTTIETLTWFLSEVSPRTVAAMQHFVHLPDLF